MRTFAIRIIANPIFAVIFVAATLLVSDGFAGQAKSLHSPLSVAHQNAAALSTRTSVENERAKSPMQLMQRWAPLIKEASLIFGLAEDWIKAVIRLESGGRKLLNDKPITSNAGAMGIMQLMPATYREMRKQYGLGPNPYDPHDNVLAGTAYLRWLYNRYGYPRMFAAYNAGPATLDAQLAGTSPLPAETRAYVDRIARILDTAPPSSAPQATEISVQSKPVARLTRPDGSPIWVDAAAVDFVRAPLSNEYPASVRSVLELGSLRQPIREDLVTVASLLKRRP